MFGVLIEALVNVDDMVENAPALMNQEQQASSSRVVMMPRRGLELPPGACLIANKKLEASDVSPLQSRFLIPNCKEILRVFIDLKRNMIENENKSLKVLVRDCRQRCYSMNLTKWPSVNKFVLNKGWNKLVRANGLKKGDVVELWCYRQGSDLLFAVDICKRSVISTTDH